MDQNESHPKTNPAYRNDNAQHDLNMPIFLKLFELMRAISYLIGMGLIFLILLVSIFIQTASTTKLLVIPIFLSIGALLLMLGYISLKVTRFRLELLEKQKTNDSNLLPK